MKVVVIGFMGTGKSTVAAHLAPHLNLSVIEMDALIQSREGMTIPEIFEQRGEAYFRQRETEIAESLANATNCIISCGGGVVLHPANLAALRRNGGIVVFLRTEFSEICSRIGENSDRPLFRDLAQARALYASREQLYRAAADIVIDTDTKSIEEVSATARRQLIDYALSERGDRRALDQVGSRKLLVVIGDPVAHSRSPLMHTAALAAAGLEETYKFYRLRVPSAELASAIAELRQRRVRGISVTMPHKEAIMPLLDELDPAAEQLGAVNTVVGEGDRLIGYNTDWVGVVEPLRQRTALSGVSVAVLGAGGAARAAVYGLHRAGAVVTIINRRREPAQEIAARYDAGVNVSSISDLSKVKIIVNATSVGMQPGECLVEPNALRSDHLVFDLVYNRLETELIKRAKTVGAEAISGWEMFLMQGARQFLLYTGIEANMITMQDALIRNLMSSHD